MKRPSATTLKPHDDDTDYLPGTHPFLEDASSPYISNTNGHMSDSDGLSDSSKIIRKKRNTYQKISDDIRVQLLEAVQNGETLKAAAKRHKINYSSAKSILHTYRKEGRILKKSAQERTTKKKSDEETPQKPVKASKKENVQPTSLKRSQLVTASGEKGKQQQLPQQVMSESTPLGCMNDNMSTVKKLEYHHAEDNSHGKMSTEGDNKNNKYYDNFHMSYYDAPVMETANDHHHNNNQQHQQQPYQGGEGPEYTNYLFGQSTFDPFSEMMNSMHHNTSALMYPKGFNAANPLDDKMGKGEQQHVMNYEDGGDNCPLRGFMDSQNLFRQALRKASFFSMGGNSTGGYRKDSMDLF